MSNLRKCLDLAGARHKLLQNLQVGRQAGYSYDWMGLRTAQEKVKSMRNYGQVLLYDSIIDISVEQTLFVSLEC